jgi:hypothetical protein
MNLLESLPPGSRFQMFPPGGGPLATTEAHLRETFHLLQKHQTSVQLIHFAYTEGHLYGLNCGSQLLVIQTPLPLFQQKLLEL